MGKLLWRKRVCVCARVCAHTCARWGGEAREEGEKRGRKKQNKRKQPNSKDMWFSSCGLMQGLGGLSKDQSPDCGRAKD